LGQGLRWVRNRFGYSVPVSVSARVLASVPYGKTSTLALLNRIKTGWVRWRRCVQNISLGWCPVPTCKPSALWQWQQTHGGQPGTREVRTAGYAGCVEQRRVKQYRGYTHWRGKQPGEHHRKKLTKKYCSVRCANQGVLYHGFEKGNRPAKDSTGGVEDRREAAD